MDHTDFNGLVLPPYLAASLFVGGEPAGCGRRKVEPAWAGFFAAFGFLTSRLLRLRPLAKTILLRFAHAACLNDRSELYGVFLSALWVNACPVAERSWPAPAVVWHAPSNGAAPIRTKSARVIESVVRMVMILSHTSV
jgi:hypothetical protein